MENLILICVIIFFLFIHRKNLEEGLNIYADARTIIEMCESKELNDVPERSLLNIQAPPDPPSQKFKEQLSSLDVSLSDDAKWVKAFCWDHPIAVIRNLSSFAHLNRTYFWTGNICDLFRKLKIERRTQMQQSSEENWDKTYSNKVWKCYSRRSYVTIKKYGKYQTNTAKTVNKNEEEQIHMALENCENMQHIKRNKVHLGIIVVNIRNFEKKWKLQLEELEKLPSFVQMNSENNMLNYIDHEILGVHNSIQFYMMVYINI